MTLHLGRWQDVLADVVVDALIVDPPYGSRVHDGYNAMEKQMRDATGQSTRTAINYTHWTVDDVDAFVASWSPRVRGWICAMTSDDLAPCWRDAFERHDRYSFSLIPVIQKKPRLLGDGPASWTVWLMVARPRTSEFSRWGCLPGAYFSRCEKHGVVAGAKPLDLMQSIVRDYSRPSDLVCDPCAGGATTLLAALTEGRRAIGAEMDPITHAAAQIRLARGYTPLLPGMI